MRQDTNKYQYGQLETYKESLELKHIKTKTLIINLVLFVFAFVVGYFLIKLEIKTTHMAGILTLFGVLFVANLSLYSYSHDLFNNLKLAMYFNSILVFVIAVSLILIFQTPSIFTILFLAYAVTAIYQDYKVMILSNFTLFLTGSLLVVRFTDIFSIPGSTASQNVLILIFLIVFVLLLTLSSYILIKRKSFFYNQLAQIKESEVRNMDLLMEVENIHMKKKFNSTNYYKSLELFSKELSRKIGIENIFSRKIKLLKDLKKYNLSEINERYPDYSIEEIKELKNLELSVNKKMRNIGIKSSKSIGIEVTRKEIFSESQFKSFKHFDDEMYVKIISFVVFYCLLKIDKPYLKELSEDKVKDIFLNSEYYYKVDRDVLNIYLENNKVFDTIVNDLLKDNLNYASHT